MCIDSCLGIKSVWYTAVNLHWILGKLTVFYCSGLNALTNILNMYYMGNDLAGRSVCTAHIVIGALSLSSNPMFITVMAAERFISIHFPLKAKVWITASRTKKVRSTLTYYHPLMCLSVYLYVQATTFEPLKLGTLFSACRYILTTSRSSFSIKVIGSMSRSI